MSRLTQIVLLLSISAMSHVLSARHASAGANSGLDTLKCADILAEGTTENLPDCVK